MEKREINKGVLFFTLCHIITNVINNMSNFPLT